MDRHGDRKPQRGHAQNQRLHQYFRSRLHEFQRRHLAVECTSSSTFLPALTAVNVNGPFGSYAGGAVIDTNGFSDTIAASLLAPSGSGVSSLALSTSGSGYIGAPYVSIAGSGSGATAIANMVDDGTGNGTYKIGSITITNPGVGYTGALSFSLTGGGATTPATSGSVTIAANTSGGLTKVGSGTLTLTATNTYSGPTAVSGGTLQIGNNTAIAGAMTSATVSLSNSASFALSPSDSPTYNTTISGAGQLDQRPGSGTLTLASSKLPIPKARSSTPAT